MTPETKFAEVYNDTNTYPLLSDVGNALGIAPRTVRERALMIRRRHERGEPVPALISRQAKAASVRPVGFEHRDIDHAEVDPDEPIEDLLKRTISASERHLAHQTERSIIDVRIKTDGPFGVVGLPDHHLNNIGTLVRRAFDDAYVINTHPALYCVGIGDWLDNFIVGYLERERRKDVISHGDSWRLLEHYFAVLAPKMIAGISGNHMDWTTAGGGVDVMKKLFNDNGLGRIYDPDQVRVRLNTPDGAEFIHLARHKYRGNSRFNSVHSITLQILEGWEGEDVVWGGHIHQAGHVMIQKNWLGESKAVHGIQLGSYKVHDSYAVREHFRQNQPFLTPMVIHIPATGETLFFDDMYRGIQVLDMLRAEK